MTCSHALLGGTDEETVCLVCDARFADEEAAARDGGWQLEEGPPVQAMAHALIQRERARQEALVVQGRIVSTCASTLLSAEEKLAVLMEEVGEVARAILEQDPSQLRVEAVHVAAVATAWVEALVEQGRH